MSKNASSLVHPAAGSTKAGHAWLNAIASTTSRLDAGKALFRQGDKAFGVYQVISGKIHLVRVTSGGAEVGMHTALPGELFAEASIFSEHYHCDAIAMQDCEVMVYPKSELIAHLKGNAEMLWAFTAELAQRVQSLRTRLEVRQIRAAPERVLQFLRLRCDPSGAWQQEGTLKHFAEELGLTHEALYRALATLERRGSIKRERHALRILVS